MNISIIIPFYNGGKTIGRCLDSIYTQNLPEKDFEVIIVDDCSTDSSSVKILQDYSKSHPDNLKVIRHTVNKRQGGARNTGIKVAKGKWILFIDQDDFFVDNSIKQIHLLSFKHGDFDFIMFDSHRGDGTEIHSIGTYTIKKTSEKEMTGEEFLMQVAVPWSPWQYLYNRNTLVSTGIEFEENVRFEDTDFVLEYTAKAKKCRFIPIVVLYHVIHKEQTSTIKNNISLILDIFKMNFRVYQVAMNEKEYSETASKAIMGHAIYMRKANILKYLWRLSFKDMKKTLKQTHFSTKIGNSIVDFTNSHITFTCIILTILKPAFHIAVLLKRLKK